MITLQTLLDDIAFDNLPFDWATFDFASFSQSKRLWGYQQTALQNALKALWKYYDGACDAAQRKTRFLAWYRDNDVALDASLPLGKQRDNVALLERYYPVEIVSAGKGGADALIGYEYFNNRVDDAVCAERMKPGDLSRTLPYAASWSISRSAR